MTHPATPRRIRRRTATWTRSAPLPSAVDAVVPPKGGAGACRMIPWPAAAQRHCVGGARSEIHGAAALVAAFDVRLHLAFGILVIVLLLLLVLVVFSVSALSRLVLVTLCVFVVSIDPILQKRRFLN